MSDQNFQVTEKVGAAHTPPCGPPEAEQSLDPARSLLLFWKALLFI